MEKQIDRIVKIEKTLFGNGEIGMDEKLREIYRWMKEQQERIPLLESERQKTSSQVSEIYNWMMAEKRKNEEKLKNWDDERRFYRRSVVAPALAAIVMLLFNGFLWFFKLVPVLNELQK